MRQVAIVDYGMGNLGSVRRALEECGATPVVVDDPTALAGADKIILPGVGAFHDGMAQLREKGWDDALRETLAAGTPLLGICLGMQLLFAVGFEGGESPGLGLVPGAVRRLDELGCTERIPHVGWNDIRIVGDQPLFRHIADGTDFYFVHSYACAPDSADAVAAVADYGIPFVAAVSHGAAMGVQFHPEKSSKAGFQLLRNFLAL